MKAMTLFVGAATLILFGAIFHDKSIASGGLVLMWIGLSVVHNKTA